MLRHGGHGRAASFRGGGARRVRDRPVGPSLPYGVTRECVARTARGPRHARKIDSARSPTTAACTVRRAMFHTRIDISEGLDGEPVVLACFDLGGEEIAASAHAVAVTAAERFRTASMSVDDVLELRELTALADELADLARRPGMSTVVLRPARLSAYRDAVARFVESRDEASGSARRTASHSRASAACSLRSRSSAPRRCAPRSRRRRAPADKLGRAAPHIRSAGAPRTEAAVQPTTSSACRPAHRGPNPGLKRRRVEALGGRGPAPSRRARRASTPTSPRARSARVGTRPGPPRSRCAADHPHGPGPGSRAGARSGGRPCHRGGRRRGGRAALPAG